MQEKTMDESKSASPSSTSKVVALDATLGKARSPGAVARITTGTSVLNFASVQSAGVHGAAFENNAFNETTDESQPTVSDVGTFVDSVAGQRRTASAVAGRLIEEVTELGLATGLSAGQILAHVADALHNESLKASKNKTVFPSRLAIKDANLSDLAIEEAKLTGECADVGLVLKDLCHVAKVNLAQAESSKWEKFKRKKFVVTDQGTIYAAKSHIVI
jgi:NTP pyrophosphatase (non-canonical NTP hydrolase)